MSINNIKRVLLSLAIGLFAGSVMAVREPRVAFAPLRPRRDSVVASPLTRQPLKQDSVTSKVPAAPSLAKAKKERMTFGGRPQQVRRGL